LAFVALAFPPLTLESLVGDFILVSSVSRGLEWGWSSVISMPGGIGRKCADGASCGNIAKMLGGNGGGIDCGKEVASGILANATGGTNNGGWCVGGNRSTLCPTGIPGIDGGGSGAAGGMLSTGRWFGDDRSIRSAVGASRCGGDTGGDTGGGTVGDVPGVDD